MNNNEKDSKSTSLNSTDNPNASHKPLRIWIPILLLLILLALRFSHHVITDKPELIMAAVFGPVVCGGLIMLWWLLISRATWKERWVGMIGVSIVAALTVLLMHPTIRGPAMMFITIPMGLGLFGVGAVLCSKCAIMKRAITAVLFAAVGFGASLLIKSEGLWGNNEFGISWRWVKSDEERMLAGEGVAPKKSLQDLDLASIDQRLQSPEWRGFRGQFGNGIQRNLKLKTEWPNDVSKPLWKISVGPGWSSFSLAGELLFTQEQRGDSELVVCYDANSGGEIWNHKIKSRFEDALGGPGPRATPTIGQGKIFALGANGTLLCLEPKTGKLVWEQDLQKIAKRKPPMWGFCSSPLVVESKVIVHAGGDDDLGTLAFDVASGDLSWSVPAGDHSYASADLFKLCGRDVVAMLTNKELTLINPSDGKVIFDYPWEFSGYRSLQPKLIDSDSLILPSGIGQGVKRLKFKVIDDTWTAEEVWVCKRFKTDFNDFVIVNDHAYGFNSAIFCCVDMTTGEFKWRGGRYGKGQVLGLEQGQLLVLSEQGEVVLLAADASKLNELTRFKAIEGKTWNHPVLVGDRLFVRNSKEAACFRLPLEK